MSKIQKLDLRQIDYAEFGAIVGRLTDAIVHSRKNYDLIVPILRSGGLTGMHLASKLRVTNILPAQYKYTYEDKVSIVKKFDFPKLHFVVAPKPRILVVESNTVAGTLAGKVIRDVVNAYPTATIDFASACLDQSLVEATLATEVFYGVLSNERRLLSSDEAKRRQITNELLIFPWENLDEQWEEIQALQN